jgi:hypothetical protein
MCLRCPGDLSAWQCWHCFGFFPLILKKGNIVITTFQFLTHLKAAIRYTACSEMSNRTASILMSFRNFVTSLQIILWTFFISFSLSFDKVFVLHQFLSVWKYDGIWKCCYRVTVAHAMSNFLRRLSRACLVGVDVRATRVSLFQHEK